MRVRRRGEAHPLGRVGGRVGEANARVAHPALGREGTLLAVVQPVEGENVVQELRDARRVVEAERPDEGPPVAVCRAEALGGGLRAPDAGVEATLRVVGRGVDESGLERDGHEF